MSNQFVELVPFSVSDHAETLYNLTQDPRLYANFPFGPFDDYESFKRLFTTRGPFEQSFQRLAFAIISKTRGTLAGFTALVDANQWTRAVTIGTLFIIPHQPMELTANVIGLLLQRALNPPSHSGLGLVRVQMGLDSRDKALAHNAKVIGLRYETSLKWFHLVERGLTRGKRDNGKPPPPGTEKGDLWQDIEMYCMCWDDWIQGGCWQGTLFAMMRDAVGNTAMTYCKNPEDFSPVAILGMPGV